MYKAMYLDNGREIYECDQYPGYYIDANTGAFCDEDGHYVGGNIDEGDKPGGNHINICTRTVWVSKSGKQYYPKRNKTATIPLTLEEARRRRYKPSSGYKNYIIKLIRKKN